jgi:hypothetical protein
MTLEVTAAEVSRSHVPLRVIMLGIQDFPKRTGRRGEPRQHLAAALVKLGAKWRSSFEVPISRGEAA